MGLNTILYYFGCYYDYNPKNKWLILYKIVNPIEVNEKKNRYYELSNYDYESKDIILPEQPLPIFKLNLDFSYKRIKRMFLEFCENIKFNILVTIDEIRHGKQIFYFFINGKYKKYSFDDLKKFETIVNQNLPTMVIPAYKNSKLINKRKLLIDLFKKRYYGLKYSKMLTTKKYNNVNKLLNDFRRNEPKVYKTYSEIQNDKIVSDKQKERELESENIFKRRVKHFNNHHSKIYKNMEIINPKTDKEHNDSYFLKP